MTKTELVHWLRSSSRDEITQRCRELSQAEQEQVAILLRNIWPSISCPSLAEFVEATTQYTLEPWQVAICDRLQRLANETGQRVLLHAPPQFGKSVLVSQRFPAWLAGLKPEIRLRLACYNETHSERFSKVNLSVMNDPAFSQAFPCCGVPGPNASGREWSTAQRKAKRDGQPSFSALGIGSGFVGLGADTLIIDDPYKSAEEAFSQTTNANVWLWWQAVVLPRLNPETNVVVMFHRWHAADIAGKLLEQGGWEQIRYPAIADGLPGDCTGLPPGTALSPRFSVPFLRSVEEQQGTTTFQALYQGTPGDAAGNLIRSDWCRTYSEVDGAYILRRGERLDRVEKGLCWVFCAVDWASSEAKTADWTVVSTWAVTPRRDLLLLEVVRGREEGPEAKELVRGRLNHWRPIFAAVEKNGVGLPMTQDLQREGYPIRGIWQHQSKPVRAQSLASAYEAGRVYHPEGPQAAWLPLWVSELLAFPRGAADDQVDTGSVAVRCIAGPNSVVSDFSASFHVDAAALGYEPAQELLIGWACEPVPACVVCQMDGEVLCVYLGEVAQPGEGMESFVLRVAGLIQGDFCPPGKKSGDLPALGFCPEEWLHGPKGHFSNLFADAGGGEGVGLIPCPSTLTREEGDEAIRLRCRALKGGRALFVVDPLATELIAALCGGYCYRLNIQGLPTPSVEENASSALGRALGLACANVGAVRGVVDPMAVYSAMVRRNEPVTRVAGGRGR